MKAIRATLECSDFFNSHEVIGSSLLFVHDRTQASVWLIDFAKTVVLPSHIKIDHNSVWSVGNHEDGYLIGINNLISIFEELRNIAEEEERDRELELQDEEDALCHSSILSRCSDDEQSNNIIDHLQNISLSPS